MRQALTSVIAACFSFYATRKDPDAPLCPNALLPLVSRALSLRRGTVPGSQGGLLGGEPGSGKVIPATTWGSASSEEIPEGGGESLQYFHPHNRLQRGVITLSSQLSDWTRIIGLGMW